MKAVEALDKLLRSFERYYNINRNDALPPFSAEAEFHSHTEQYMLVRAAHLSDVDSNEFVYFYTADSLNLQTLTEIDTKAWENGLSRVKIYDGHRNTDVTLVIVSDSIDEDAFKQIKKFKHYKSYTFGLRGWSHYKLVAMETSSGKLTSNWMGQDLKKLFKTIN